MSKKALLVIRIACLIVVGSFFFSYFVVECNGVKVNISGFDAAFGIDKGEIPLDPSPIVLLIPVIALVVWIALSITSIRNRMEGAKSSAINSKVEQVKKLEDAIKKLEDSKSPVKYISAIGIIPAVGGVVGLLLLAYVHYRAIGRLRSEIRIIDISSLYHTGFGFKTSVCAFVTMLVMPFVDKYLLSKNSSSQSDITPDNPTE